MSPTIQLISGDYFNFEEPDPQHITLSVIAHALSNQCRFSGHVRRFYCPTPDQRVLTSDLSWIPAGDLKVGDRLLGFDEHPHQPGAAGTRRRRYRPSVVTHATAIRRRLVRLVLSDGSSVVASEEHPWLCATKASRNQTWMTSKQIFDDLGLGRRRYLHKFLEPWGASLGRDAGWLAGILDGEGYLSFTNRKGVQAGVSQRPGLVLQEIERLLTTFGADPRASNTGSSDVISYQLGGGWREIARLLGTVRPIRLIDKFEKALFSGAFEKQMDGAGPPLEVVDVYLEGEDWVAGLETSTHTYICEGFGAHNSVAEHCVRGSYVCKDPLAFLLHDAAEAFIVDIPSPLKPLLPGYKEIETRIHQLIERRFDVSILDNPAVKHTDLVMLATEKEDLMPPDRGEAWDLLDGIEPLKGLELSHTSGRPETWARRYIERFQELWGLHHNQEGGAA